MSRCFPFPPPGYERQARIDHVDLLSKEKEKEKEKKRKKEKRDKEKREGKDKKDKDRSKDKHKEKKERKEKHKDKKKEKEKDKSPLEGVFTDKQDDPNHRELSECSLKTKEINHSKFTDDLDRRIKDEQKVAASRMVENIHVPSHRSIANTASPSLLGDRVVGSRVIQSPVVDSQKRNDRVERPADNILNSAKNSNVHVFANVTQKEKYTNQKLAPKLVQKGDALSMANSINREKNTSQTVAPKLLQKGDVQGLGTVVLREHLEGQRLAPKSEQKGVITEESMQNSKFSIRKPEGILAASAEKENKSKKSELNSASFVQKPINGLKQPAQAFPNLPRENASIVSLSSKTETKKETEKISNLVGQRDVEEMGRLMGKGGQRVIVGTDNKEDQSRKEEKQKDRDHKKLKSKKKNKEREKDKEQTKDKSERKKEDLDELEHKEKEGHLDGLKLKVLAAPVDDTRNQFSTDKIKKRKETESNGFLHENDSRLNKFPKTTSSHHPVENGRRFQESSPITTDYLFIKPEATNNAIAAKLPINGKNHVTNGSSEAQPLSTPLRHLDMANISATRASKKPHPDEKYLNQIYSVPKIEVWQDYDDQEWLFSGNQSRQKQQLTSEAVQLPQVWAEALKVVSDDVIAMPYVIPF